MFSTRQLAGKAATAVAKKVLSPEEIAKGLAGNLTFNDVFARPCDFTEETAKKSQSTNPHLGALGNVPVENSGVKAAIDFCTNGKGTANPHLGTLWRGIRH